MKTSKASVAAAVSALVLLSGAASADTVKAKFTSSLQKTANITSPALNGNVSTVKFTWTRTDAPGPGVDAVLPNVFTTYCVDLAQTVTGNTNYTFDVLDLADAGYTATQMDLLTNLFAEYFPVVSTADDSAAFQLAVWNVIYDTDTTTSAGTFRASSPNASIATATSWLGTVSAPGFVRNGAAPQLVVLRSPTNQDQIALVPSPATGALAAAGAALALRRRRSAR